MPKPNRHFGFECELSAGSARTAELLHERGLMAHSEQHRYHCSCSDCQPITVGNRSRSVPLFKYQTDSTCDGEIITHILTYGSRAAERAVSGLEAALRDANAQPGTNAGQHCHVSMAGLDWEGFARLARLFYVHQDELEQLARHSFTNVRGYNHRLSQFYIPRQLNPNQNYVPGSWLVFKAHGEGSGRTQTQDNWYSGLTRTIRTHLPVDYTAEFRLWNSTRAAWRMRMAINVSVAMVEAAKAGIDTGRNNTRPLVETIRPWLDDWGWAGILRQQAMIDEYGRSILVA